MAHVGWSLLALAAAAIATAAPNAAAGAVPPPPSASAAPEQPDEPSAADRETARSLLKSGDAKYAAGDYVGALDDYWAADRLVGVPTTRLAIGKAQAAMGALVEARDTLLGIKRIEAAADEPKAFAAAREEADSLAASLADRIPALTFVVQGVPADAPVTLTIDREGVDRALFSIARKVNPGGHTVIVSSPGYKTVESRFELGEGERRALELVLRPDFAAPVGTAAPLPEPTRAETPPPAPTPLPPSPMSEPASPAVWVGLGIGAAGLVAGAVAGIIASKRASELKDQCVENQCPRAETEDDHDRALVAAHASTVGFVVAGTGGIVALIGAIVNAADNPPPTVESAGLVPVVGVGTVGLRGSF